MTRLAPLCLLLACGSGPDPSDRDRDGLLPRQEKRAGTERLDADTDGDGLSDGDEVFEHGTDPTLADTDGDTYPDALELELGTDPRDHHDRYYQGYWPYQPDKDALGEPVVLRSRPELEVGERFPRLQYRDASGDRVDLYDFAGEPGVEAIVLVPLELWYGVGWDAVAWVDHGHPQSRYAQDLPGLRAAVTDGRVRVVAVLDAVYLDEPEPASTDVLKAWTGRLQAGRIPLLLRSADEVSLDYGWMGFYVLDPATMRIETTQLQALEERL